MVYNLFMNLKVKYLKSIQEKTLGLLMFNKPLPVMFKTRFGIHTFGLQYPIDIIILNNKNVTVKLCHKLPPNRLFFWNPKYDKVIELPEGFIDKYRIKFGQIIKLIFE